MADEGVGGLAYSGKIMSPTPFTPVVAEIRDELYETTGERFDCALLNLYPDGSTACKYHTDPDLGRLWARDSIIVSVGETRRFAFRRLGANDAEAHWFRVRSGDCIHMFADCNDAYEHCVMRAEGEDNDAPRASIVFKRSMATASGKRGHGLRGEGRARGRRGGGGGGGGIGIKGVKSGDRGGGGGGRASRAGRGRGGRGGGGRGGRR